MTIQADTPLTIALHGGKRPERFHGTPAEIVRVMHATAFIPAENDQSYMERFAHFSELIDGRPLRTTSAEAFIADLLALGIAERIEDGVATVAQSSVTASR